MTREEARKAAEVMMAYAEGKEVEFCEATESTWKEINKPVFNWHYGNYRIKKEPTYRPFKDKEEFLAEMEKHQPFGWLIEKKTNLYYSIIGLNSICPYFSNDCGDDYERLLKYAVFADGTPFGIKEEL